MHAGTERLIVRVMSVRGVELYITYNCRSRAATSCMQLPSHLSNAQTRKISRKSINQSIILTLATVMVACVGSQHKLLVDKQ